MVRLLDVTIRLPHIVPPVWTMVFTDWSKSRGNGVVRMGEKENE